MFLVFCFFLMLSCFCLPSGPVLNPSVLCFLELSLCAGNLQLDSRRREFTSCGNGKRYFDTHALVCVLEENGNLCQSSLRAIRKHYLTASSWSYLISYISLWLWSLQGRLWIRLHFFKSLFFAVLGHFCFISTTETFLLHFLFVQVKCMFITSL